MVKSGWIGFAVARIAALAVAGIAGNQSLAAPIGIVSSRVVVQYHDNQDGDGAVTIVSGPRVNVSYEKTARKLYAWVPRDGKMVPLAEQIGGYLNITNQRQKITTVEFSFPLKKEDEQMEEEI